MVLRAENQRECTNRREYITWARAITDFTMALTIACKSSWWHGPIYSQYLQHIHTHTYTQTVVLVAASTIRVHFLFLFPFVNPLVLHLFYFYLVYFPSFSFYVHILIGARNAVTHCGFKRI